MSELRKTSEALSNLGAQQRTGIGDHTNPDLATGVYGNIVLGEVQFDPNVHSPIEIDHLSMMGVAMDELYVTEVLPENPIIAHVIVDGRDRQDYPALAKAKQKLASLLVVALDQALPGMSDVVYDYRLVDDIQQRKGLREDIIAYRGGRELSRDLHNLGSSGIKFLISDFGSNIFKKSSELKLDGTVAIKVNHLLERQVPRGIGRISVGGAREIDTNNPKSLAPHNSMLKESHDDTVARLESAGASVASVVVDGQIKPDGIDFLDADRQIAAAITSQDK